MPSVRGANARGLRFVLLVLTMLLLAGSATALRILNHASHPSSSSSSSRRRQVIQRSGTVQLPDSFLSGKNITSISSLEFGGEVIYLNLAGLSHDPQIRVYAVNCSSSSNIGEGEMVFEMRPNLTKFPKYSLHYWILQNVVATSDGSSVLLGYQEYSGQVSPPTMIAGFDGRTGKPRYVKYPTTPSGELNASIYEVAQPLRNSNNAFYNYQSVFGFRTRNAIMDIRTGDNTESQPAWLSYPGLRFSPRAAGGGGNNLTLFYDPQPRHSSDLTNVTVFDYIKNKNITKFDNVFPQWFSPAVGGAFLGCNALGYCFYMSTQENNGGQLSVNFPDQGGRSARVKLFNVSNSEKPIATELPCVSKDGTTVSFLTLNVSPDTYERHLLVLSLHNGTVLKRVVLPKCSQFAVSNVMEVVVVYTAPHCINYPNSENSGSNFTVLNYANGEALVASNKTDFPWRFYSSNDSESPFPPHLLEPHSAGLVAVGRHIYTGHPNEPRPTSQYEVRSFLTGEQVFLSPKVLGFQRLGSGLRKFALLLPLNASTVEVYKY